MNPDRGVEVGIDLPHDRGHRPAGRHPGHVYAVGIDVVLAEDFARDAGDNGWLALAAPLVRGLEPVPSPRAVGGGRLYGIGNEEGVLLGDRVHVGACGQIVGGLGTAVEHDYEGHLLPHVAAGNVQLVGARPGSVGVGPLDEAPPAAIAEGEPAPGVAPEVCLGWRGTPP